MSCIKLSHHEKNTLRAFVDLGLLRVGLMLRECPRLEKNEQEWVSFPASLSEGDDGGTRWQPVIKFAASAKQAHQQFQRQAIATINIFNEQDRGSAS